MKKRYATLNCCKELREIPFKNPFIKHCGNKMIQKHILKRFPLGIKEILLANQEGYSIQFPLLYTNEDEEYIGKVIQGFNQHLVHYDLNILIVDEKLKKYKDYFNLTVSEGKNLGILYIRNILEVIKNEIDVPDKMLKYVIVDGPSSDSEYILDHITDGINSLIFVTDNPMRYEKKFQEIYEETGLAIQVKGKRIHQDIEGDIIIQCNNMNDKLFYCYQDDCTIVDFTLDKDSIQNIKLKRKNLKIISEFTPFYLEKKWDPDLLLGIILNQERIARNIYIHGYKYSVKEKIDNILDRYPVNFYVY